MAIPFLNDVDFQQNELQNAVLQNLASAPSNPVAGQMYFNTVDNLMYTFDGTAWITGKTYAAGDGIDITNGTISADTTIARKTDLEEFITLTDLTIAASSTNYLEYNNSTGAFGAKVDGTVTEDSTNLVTSGAAFDAIEGAVADKIELTDLSIASASANYLEYNNANGQFGAKVDTTVTEDSTKLVTSGAVFDAVEPKIELTDLTIAAASTNYLTYDNATGAFGAKVDGTVTSSSTNLITSGAVQTAIDNALVGGVIYEGTWNATGQTDYSSITLPVKKGYLYYVTGSATIGGVEWKEGDFLIVNADVAAGGTLTNVTKIDNTEASDIVRLDAAQTLTNKTIDAASNTISNLATSNFASGVVTTVLAGTATASATVLPSEKAVADALASAVDGMVTVDGAQTLTNKTIDADDNTIADLELDNFKAGVVQTVVRATTSASDTAIASEKAIASGLAVKTEKFTATNGALTATAGLCTWEITNSIGSADIVVQIFRVSDNVQVMAEVAIGASTITVKMNSAADIAANTYKAVVIGL